MKILHVIAVLFVDCLDMSHTRQFQCKFDIVLSLIEDIIKRKGTSLQKVIAQVCKDVTMSEEFNQDFKTSTDIANAFNWIRVYTTWYQRDLLSYLSHFVDDADFVKDYMSDLQKYFKHRVAALPATKEEEMFLVRIDSAWDAEALHGAQCVTSCKQIAAILNKQGRVTGTLHKPYLFISIT